MFSQSDFRKSGYLNFNGLFTFLIDFFLYCAGFLLFLPKHLWTINMNTNQISVIIVHLSYPLDTYFTRCLEKSKFMTQKSNNCGRSVQKSTV